MAGNFLQSWLANMGWNQPSSWCLPWPVDVRP